MQRYVEALEGDIERPAVDLDAYCERIGYRGPRTPTTGTLRALQELHPAAIPFEAIDVLLDRGIDLSPGAVDAKLIDAGRGGYCYEHNGLFKRVLTAIGFEVEILLGRVRWMAPAGAPPEPRTHMVLRMTIDGTPWLADTGFGSATPTAPLRADTTEPQQTRFETYRVIPFGDALLVQAWSEDGWMPLYELPQEPQLDADIELPNWFVSTHPASHFRRNLIAARAATEARYALLDNRLTVRSADGTVERRILDADQIEASLSETFGLPVEPAWRPAIERAAEADTAA